MKAFELMSYTYAFPSVGGRKPVSMLMVVVLPAPLGPSSAKSCLLSMVYHGHLTACLLIDHVFVLALFNYVELVRDHRLREAPIRRAEKVEDGLADALCTASQRQRLRG
jgi:hypothetical protein